MKLFGQKKAPPPNLQESIQRLRDAEQNLEKREKFLEKQAAACLEEAKRKSHAKDKRGALFQLKKKKMYETQMEQIYGKKSNIETQILALENAGITGDVVTAMQHGERALRQTLAQHKIEKVEDVMESITETMDQADELSEALSTPIGPVYDEDALEAELEDLESELADEMALQLPSVPVKAQEVTPAVVASKPVVQAAAPKPVMVQAGGGGASSKPAAGKPLTKEEKELRELEELMGM